MSRSPADQVLRRMVARVRAAARTLNLQLTHVPDLAGVSRSHFWDVMAGRKSPTLGWLARVATALECEPADLLAGGVQQAQPLVRESRRVPLMSLRAAAGAFRGPEEVEPAGYIKVSARRVVKPGMFAAAVSGRSMEPVIRDGSICLFRTLEERDPNDKVVLVQLRDASDPETGGRYTVKKLKAVAGRDGRIRVVRLEPLNREFKAMVLKNDPMERLTPVAEFLEVLVPGPG